MAAAALCALLLATGCIGEIRSTTTARTSTEMLLVSTSAERAVNQYDYPPELKGKKVAIDDTKFDSVDKNYVVSALRNYVSEHGSLLVGLAPAKTKDAAGKDVEVPPDRVIEVRNADLGVNDKSFGIGIPPLPVPVPNTTLTAGPLPGIFLFYRKKQEGWAKFQLWVFDPRQDAFVSKSKDLWGHAYYSQFHFFGIGPFDFSNDIYPEEDLIAIPK